MLLPKRVSTLLMLAGKELKSDFSVRALIIFLIANALKSAIIYNFFDSSYSFGLLLLHFIPALLFSSIIFLLILRLGSRVIFIAAYLASITFLLINIIYFAHFNNFINLSNSNFMFLDGLQLILGQSFTWDSFCLIVLVDLPSFLYLLKLFNHTVLAVKRVTTKRWIISSLTSLLVIAHGIIFAVSPATNSENTLGRQIVLRHGLIVHNIVDILKDPSRKSRSGTINYGNVFSNKATASGPHSIIMLQVESLDAFIVNFRHNGNFVAPFLHDLAGKSIYYPYVLTTRRTGVTSDCELSVLNSIEPFEQYPSMLSDNYSFPNAVTKRLRKNKYEICAFHGNKGNFYNRELAYPQMGFDKFFDIEAMGLNEVGWGAPDHELFGFAEKKLAEETRPFFYYLITMSSHEPFQSPLQYYAVNKYDDIPDSLTRNYFRSISYVDGELEKFVQKVAVLHPEAYIFIYGDHTPFALDIKQFHRAFFSQNNLEFEFVPLFIITPEHRKAKERIRVASYLDFAATIISASGSHATINSNGTNLLNTPLKESTVLFHNSEYDRKTLFHQIDMISPEN